MPRVRTRLDNVPIQIEVPDTNKPADPTITLGTVIVNNIQCMCVELRQCDKLVFLEVDAVELIQHKPLVNGRMALEAHFFSASGELSRVCEGRLVIDDGAHVFRLGPLQQQERPVTCATLLERKPRKFRFELEQVDVPPFHPSEELLADHCLALLEGDEYNGSLPSSHLQNLVREMPFYKTVIGPICPTWTDFVRSRSDLWDIFKYPQQEIDDKQLQGTCRTKENRVVAKKHAPAFKDGDVARDRMRGHSETALLNFLRQCLSERPYEQTELLQLLVKQSSFLSLLTPNYTKILDQLEHDERFFVLRHPLYPIVVERRRSDYKDDPRFDTWDNTEEPRYWWHKNQFHEGYR